MNTNIFSSGSSVLSNDALASSWKEVQEKHFSGSARSSFRIRENYEIIPDESLPMAALYWKRKYLDLSVQDEERQGRYADLLRSYEDAVDLREQERAEKSELFLSYTDALREIERRKEKELEYIREIEKLKSELERKDEQTQELEKQLEQTKTELDDTRDKLKKAEAKLNNDSNNSGTPTSQTPYNKDKRVPPNTRNKTGRKRGGQPGHKRHILEQPDESQVTEIVEYEDPIEALLCALCGSGNIVQIGTKTVYEEEVRTTVVVRKINYGQYMCLDCGATFEAQIPKYLNPNQTTQYGPNLKTMIGTLVIYGDVSVNRVQAMIAGVTSGEIHPSQGYICKVIDNMAEELRRLCFDEELRKYIVYHDTNVLNWDDTVVSVNGKRTCIRFYGDEGVALYTFHLHKGKDGLMEDNVLPQLSQDRVIMHDHNIINYNKDVCTCRNAECCIHLERDLISGEEEFTGRTWVGRMHNLLKSAIHDRHIEEQNGAMSFSEEKIQEIFSEYQNITESAKAANYQNIKVEGETWYWLKDERALIKRLIKYRDNYLIWLKDFSIPTNNNLAERGLRLFKTKMKVSGQFYGEKSAKNFALVLSYTETAKRHGINPYESLQRLSEKRPFSVSHIMSLPVQHQLT